MNLFVAILSRSISTLRPFAPKIVPLLVCSLFIPLILLLSASAGWVVWSNLSVGWEVPLYLQYGDGIPPYAYAQLPTLIPQQRYDISAELLVPYTDSNTALGNFMTTLTLSTLSNKTLAHVRRPAIALPPQSFLFFSKAISTHVKVPLLESFIAGKSNLAAAIEVGRRDGWTTLGAGQGREVSIVSASLRGLAVPHGTRGFAIRFPMLSSLASAGIFLLILSLILGTCILPLVLPSMPGESEEAEGTVEPKRSDSSLPPASQYPAQERERRRRRSRSSRSSGEGSRTAKTEAPVETMPSAAEESTRGLRRRSSKSGIGSPDAAET
ncbi:hypothetical protein BDZ97DRAFT_1900628 [Flammula alnicola]|nr:hypothetical protein BDZ97DRAFT_1900628 [Flammula alnicola]